MRENNKNNGLQTQIRMKKIFFLSLIFSLSSIIPLMAENKLFDSSTQIVESNQRRFSKTDLVLKEGIFYLKDSDIPYSGKVIYESNKYINQSGELKNGKKVGLWIDTYNNSGILERKREYEKGKILMFINKNNNLYLMKLANISSSFILIEITR